MSTGNGVLVNKVKALNIGKTVIQVRVGKGEGLDTFWVHKDLICSRSKFFAKATTGTWKEAQDGIIELPEDKPDVFSLYLQTVYTNQLPISEKLSCHSEPMVNTDQNTTEISKEELQRQSALAATHEFTLLSKLYVLSEKLDDPEGRGLITDAVIESVMRSRPSGGVFYPGPTAINIVYEGTTKSSPMRKLMTDFYVFEGREHWIAKKKPSYHSDFLLDVVEGMLKVRERPTERKKYTASDYHEKEKQDENGLIDHPLLDEKVKE